MPVPLISISPANIEESVNGNPQLVFTVELSEAADSTVRVGYRTVQGGAAALDEGADYFDRSGTLTFSVGQTSRTVSVSIQDLDGIDETDEGVVLELFSPDNAVFAAGVITLRGTGFILDDDGDTSDDGSRVLSVSDPQIAEGGDGVRTVEFELALSRASESEITVAYNTLDGSATAGQDYVATSGSAVFAPGETRQVVAVPILGDEVAEAAEFFSLITTLSSGFDSSALESVGHAEILDDDTSANLPEVSIAAGAVIESVNTNPQIVFTVTLSEPAQSTVQIDYRTVQRGGAALDEGVDYGQLLQSISFAIGETSKTIAVTVEDLDVSDETDEAVVVELVNPENAVFPDGVVSLRATGFILDDDGGVTDAGNRVLSVSKPQIVEGAEGDVRTALFDLKLSRASQTEITVPYTTVDGSAIAGEDYVTTTGSVVFRPGQTRQVVAVPLLGDALGEETEFFSLLTTLPPGADASSAESVGVAEILDDDTSTSLPQISLSAGSVVESANTTPQMTFTVTLSEPAGSSVVVDYRTLQAGGGALDENTDYFDRSGSILFSAGETSKVVTIALQDLDIADESDEGLVLELINPEAAVFPAGVLSLRATGFILDDDGDVSDAGNRVLSVSDPQLVEGGESGRTAVFELQLSRPSETAITVPYTTVDGSATAGDDFVATSGTVVFVPGQVRQAVAVSILGDALGEAAEFFSLVTTLSEGIDNTALESVGIAEILDDDTSVSLPEISVSAGAVVESANTNPLLVFTVTLSEPAGSSVSVGYRTVQAGAAALDEGVDYTQATSTLFFSAGEASKTIVISVQDLDIADETDEGVVLELVNPGNAVFPDGMVTLRSTGFILDDDGIVSDAGNRVLSVSDPQIVEGGEGGRTAVFELKLSRASLTEITVPYNTVDGSATAGSDYVSASGNVVFAPGQTRQVVAVAVLGDAVAEATETFSLVTMLSAGIDSSAAESVGHAEILDDDTNVSLPEISLSGGAVLESVNTSPLLTFTVTLSEPAGSLVQVGYRSVQRGTGALDEGIDYFELSGTVSFNAGETSKTISVNVQDIDSVDESDEGVVVELVNPSNAVFPGGAVSVRSTGFILDDDGDVTDAGSRVLSVSDPQLVEGDEGGRMAFFDLQLSRASDVQITIPYSTVDGSALAGADYEATTGSVVFAPGQTRQVVAVPVMGDAVAEAAEFFNLITTLPAGVDSSAAESVGTAEILDDDTNISLPEISVSGGSVVESANTTPQLRFTVTLSEPSGGTVRVDFQTLQAGGAALDEGVDYFDTASTLIFSFGETSKTILVNIEDNDGIDEPDEGVVLELSNPENAVFPPGLVSLRSTGFILDDDGNVTDAGSRVLSVSDPQLVEGGAQGSMALFELQLSRASNTAITVPYSTSDGSAGAGEDYVASSGSVVFAPGQTRQVVAVTLLGDQIAEATEFFSLVTTPPSGADNSVAEIVGRAQILDDDTNISLPEISVSAGAVAESANGTPQLRYTVTLSEPATSTVQIDYRTVQNGAGALDEGVDYFETSGVLSFSAGETRKTIVVAVQDVDGIDETDEGVVLELINPDNAVFPEGAITLRSTGFILDDDGNTTDAGSRVLSVSDPQLVEGGESGRTAVFDLQLSRPSDLEITVPYSTVDGTALAGEDYLASSGSIVFSPGQTHQVVAVSVLGDDVAEATEFFTLLTTPPAGVDSSLTESVGRAEILDDDTSVSLPEVSISAGAVVESINGSPVLQFIVTLSEPAGTTVRVDYATLEEGTGASGQGVDYFDASGTLTFVAGETSKTILVNVQDVDGIDETDEGVTLELDNPQSAVFPEGVSRLRSTGFILDDDGNTAEAGSLAFRVEDAAPVIEGDVENGVAVFAAYLSRAPSEAVTITYSIQGATASAASDFIDTSGELTFAPGQQYATVAVPVLPDELLEDDETFVISFQSSSAIASLEVSQAVGTILNDDVDVTSVSDASESEGVGLAHTVELSGATIVPKSFAFAVTDISTTAGDDYVAEPTFSGGVTFDGETDTVTVPVGVSSFVVTLAGLNDSLDELVETYTLSVGDFSATGAITDDDEVTVSAATDATETEGTDLVHTVTLTGVPAAPVTFAFEITDVSATAGEDYSAPPTFSNGVTFDTGTGLVTVPAGIDGFEVTLAGLDDFTDEADETYTLAVGGQTVTGTIQSDDPTLLINGDDGDNKLSLEEIQNVIVSGGAGIDTICLPLFASEYLLEEVEPGRLEGTFEGRSITLIDVEFVEFGSFFDTTIPVDDIVSGVAKDRVEKLSDLYLAFFGRAPDVSGLEFWQEQVLELGRSFAAISADFAFSVEAQALFPPGTNNREFVRNVYLNVFGREPDTGGWDFWTGVLDALGEAAGLAGRGAFVGELILGAYAPTSGDADRDLLMNRHDVALEYVNVLSLQPEEGFDPAINQLLELVTADDATRSAAGQVIDYVFSDPVTLAGAMADTDYIGSLFG